MEISNLIETEYLKGRNPETFFSIMKEKQIKVIYDIRDFPHIRYIIVRRILPNYAKRKELNINILSN